MVDRRRNRDCDHGHPTSGKVRYLNTGGDSGVYLCRTHWAKEMAWRKVRNKTLTGKARFPIKKFPK